MANIQEVMKKRIQAMNDVFGIEPEQLRAGLTPLDVMSATGRTVDAFTGAPTRAAIGAAITGENPLTAASQQLGANPDVAPSFGTVEDALLDPSLLTGAVSPGKIGARMAALNELGAIGDLEKLSPEKLQLLASLRNRFDDPSDILKTLAMTEQYGKQLPQYFKHKSFPIPVPNLFSDKEAKVIGAAQPTWYNDPFKWMDQKYKIGKDVLENASEPLTINTASDLIGHNDYLDLIPSGSKVNVYANPLGPFYGKSAGFEGFPSNKRLKNAVDKLKAAGIDANLVARSPEASKKTMDMADAAIARKATNLIKKTNNPDFESRLDALLKALDEQEFIRNSFQKKGLRLVD